MFVRKVGELLFGLALLMILAIGVARRTRMTVAAQAATTTAVTGQPAAPATGKGAPSADPLGLFGFYLNTGFSLQPDDSYTYINAANKKVLTTDTAHSMLALFNVGAKDHFQWYRWTDAATGWQKVTDGGNEADLVLDPKQTGTVFYQQSFQYYLIVSNPFTNTYYSRVAAVTTSGTSVAATGLKVASDSQYLYNNQTVPKGDLSGLFGGGTQPVAATTYVHSMPTPANATGSLTWTSGNTDLATVDKRTGKVKANTDSRSGAVTITGTLENDGQPAVSASTTIEIGGGLNNQTVMEGQTATFHVLGAGSQQPDSVEWHRVTTKGKDTIVATSQSLDYKTPTTTMADNRTQYYAKAQLTMVDDTDGTTQKQTITTNKATLTVTPDTVPRVKITSQLKNNPVSPHDTASQLSNVIPGDQCEISGTFADDNKSSLLTTGKFQIKVPASAANVKYTIDGQAPQLPIPPYVVDDGRGVMLGVSGVDMAKGKSHHFDVTFTSQEETTVDFKTQAQVFGYGQDNQELGTYAGETLGIHFTDGSIDATAHPVTFGTIGVAEVDKEIRGSVLGSDNLLSVTDNRREKKATAVQLSQTTPFENGGTMLSQATISYNSISGWVIPLTTAGQTVINAGDDISLQSVGGEGEFLSFKLGVLPEQTGAYSATLTWAFVSAPGS